MNAAPELSDATADPGEIRGFICRCFAEWMEERYGVDEVSRRLAKADPADLAGIDPGRPGAGVIVSHWYPSDQIWRLLDHLTAGFSPEEIDEIAKQAGLTVFDRQIKGLQRALFSVMMSPSRYVRHAPKAWGHNFSNGELEFEVGPHEHKCTYRHWGGHHPLMCRMLMHGKITAYRTMGCRKAELVEMRCLGGDGCMSHVRW